MTSYYNRYLQIDLDTRSWSILSLSDQVLAATSEPSPSSTKRAAKPGRDRPTADIPMRAQAAFDKPKTIGNPRDMDVKGYQQIYRNGFA